MRRTHRTRRTHRNVRLLGGVAAAAVAVGALGGCGLLPGTEFEDEAVVKDEITSVRLANGDGAITLNGDRSAKRVSLSREVEYRMGSKPDASHKVEDGVLVLGGCGRHCTVNYTVDLPAGLAVEGRTSNGSITLTKMSTVKVTTSNGPIRLKDITGDVEAKTSNGRVEGSGLAGQRVSAESSNGPVNLSVTDPREVRIKSSNGRIDLAVPAGKYDVSADTSNGDKDIGVDTAERSDRSIELSTSNGDITVTTH